MSTKTTFKRIALVAVAALGLGVLSVAPSSAIVSQFAVTVTNGTSGLSAEGAASDSTTAAKINVSALIENGNADTITVSFVLKSIPALATTVRADIQYLDSSTPTVASSTRVDTTAVQASAFSAALETSTSGLFSISSGSASAATFVNANFGLQLDSVASTTRVANIHIHGSCEDIRCRNSLYNTNFITRRKHCYRSSYISGSDPKHRKVIR